MKKLLVILVIGFIFLISLLIFINKDKIFREIEEPESIGFSIYSKEGIRLYKKNYDLKEKVYEYDIEIPIQEGIKITESFDINLFTKYPYGYTFLTEEEYQVVTIDVENIIYKFNLHFNFYSNEFIENYKKEFKKEIYYDIDEDCKKIENCKFIYEKDL